MIMQTSAALRAKLKKTERFRSDAYIPVPDDVLTIGYGFTKGVKLGDTMTLAEADKRFDSEIIPYERVVYEACINPPNQNEFDAMVSLCYNIGPGWAGAKKLNGAKDGFRQSSVLKAHNRGDKEAASRAFSLWNKSGGRVYQGLTIRRAWEAALYIKPVPAETSENLKVVEAPIPQQVDPESTMAQSPINRAGVVAGGTAAVAAVSEVANAIADMKQNLDSLGDWLLPVALVVIVGLVGYMMWQRFQQRKGGWS